MEVINEKKLISIIPCNVFAFSDSGAIQFINDSLIEKLGFSFEELQGKSVETILTLSSRIFYQTHLFPLLKLHKKADEIFLTLLSKSKEAIPVLLNAVQQTVEGKVVNVCACITVYERGKYEAEILSAKRIAEEAVSKNEELQKVKVELEADKERLDKQVTVLRNKNKELAQLNDLFTHDLQEPVRKVSIFSDIILNDKTYLFKGDRDSIFNIIHRSTRKMQELLRGLQDYLHLNVEEMEKQPVDLNELLEKSVEAIEKECPDVAVKIQHDDLPEINANASQLSTLFKQLLHNSFKYKAKEPLEINVTCTVIEDNIYNNTEGKYRYAEFVKITFEDNGIGIIKEAREHIFKILKKGSNNTDGLGIGLALCKKIVENHGGTITIAADNKIGAKFVIIIPLK